MLIACVTGGRDFNDSARVFRVLDKLRPQVVMQGGARGADEWARRWCAERGVDCITCDALWEAHGKAAGAVRNRFMGALLLWLRAEPPSVDDTFRVDGPRGDRRVMVVHFPGGPGTENMKAVAKSYRLDLYEG